MSQQDHGEYSVYRSHVTHDYKPPTTLTWWRLNSNIVSYSVRKPLCLYFIYVIRGRHHYSALNNRPCSTQPSLSPRVTHCHRKSVCEFPRVGKEKNALVVNEWNEVWVYGRTNDNPMATVRSSFLWPLMSPPSWLADLSDLRHKDN